MPAETCRFWAQDWRCSVDGGIGDWMNSRPCVKKCCYEHDKCYEKYRCNQSSWRPIWSPCSLCNFTVATCILGADWSPNGCRRCGATK
jgi:hypothetical protein